MYTPSQSKRNTLSSLSVRSRQAGNQCSHRIVTGTRLWQLCHQTGIGARLPLRLSLRKEMQKMGGKQRCKRVKDSAVLMFMDVVWWGAQAWRGTLKIMSVSPTQTPRSVSKARCVVSFHIIHLSTTAMLKALARIVNRLESSSPAPQSAQRSSGTG